MSDPIGDFEQELLREYVQDGVPAMQEDLLPPELVFPDTVDSTMLGAFGACPTKFYYEFILRRVPQGRNIHLHAGGCYALALEIIRNRVYNDGWDLRSAKADAFKHFCVRWGNFTVGEGEAKSFENMWAAVAYYFDTYPPDTDYLKPIMRNDKAAVEYTFAIPTTVNHPISGLPILMSGRCDMIAESAQHGGLAFAVDDKTTKALGAQWLNQWDMRGQFYGYCYAMRDQGIDVAGAIVRGTAILKTQFSHAEVPVLLSNAQLERWWLNANRRIQQMVDLFEEAWHNAEFAGHNSPMPAAAAHAAALAPWPMDFGEACTSYGGCTFKPLCTGFAPWETYKDFDQRMWNPLAKDPTEGSTSKLLDAGPLETPDELRRLLGK